MGVSLPVFEAIFAVVLVYEDVVDVTVLVSRGEELVRVGGCIVGV